MNNIQKQNQKKKRKGFTLIELIIVLAVMAIIAAIAIPNFAAVRDSSKKKADTQSCETISRTVLTLVADETVKISEKTKVKVEFEDKKFKEATPTPALKGGLNELQAALKEVKSPQETDKTFYEIEIGTDGSVKTVTQ